MIGRDYFTRQATTLLKMARLSRKDPKVAVGLLDKAADLSVQAEEAPLTSSLPDEALKDLPSKGVSVD